MKRYWSQIHRHDTEKPRSRITALSEEFVPMADWKIRALNSRTPEFRKRWMAISMERRTSNLFIVKTHGIVGQEYINGSALAQG
jgi:hypothetical protein